MCRPLHSPRRRLFHLLMFLLSLALFAGVACVARCEPSSTPAWDAAAARHLLSRACFGAGLKHLAGLKRLESLELDHTKVTGAGLTSLAGMSRLKRLELKHTEVSDEGLKHLEGLRQLLAVDLFRTRVTREGVQRLQKILPETRISR